MPKFLNIHFVTNSRQMPVTSFHERGYSSPLSNNGSYLGFTISRKRAINMNKYKRAIIKRLLKRPHSVEELADIHCNAIVLSCLQELEEVKYVEHVTECYVVDSTQTPTGEKQECDNWIISLRGLDYLTERKRELLWKFLPIAISVCALVISILKR
ncbi:hypothetical protein [Paenibacillus sp. UNC451MF]|uniref:hypothetical protein n=1 Tax=Paenibacillus sp. UNC451MF TaxID=1449063 RepID=UPI00048EBD33|nr:hypothetical protein [Paenibacillus sp. UNC451MF]